MSKTYTKKEHEADQIKLLRLKNKIEARIVGSSDIKEKNNIEQDTKLKVIALNEVIGYLVRKGADTESKNFRILIDIANDYEERLNE